MSVTIHGNVKSGFEPIAKAFENAFADRPQMGASLHIVRGGKTVADLWGGVADARDGRLWEKDTPTTIFSCTKGLVSILAARLVEEGRLDYTRLSRSTGLSLPLRAKGTSLSAMFCHIGRGSLHRALISAKTTSSIGIAWQKSSPRRSLYGRLVTAINIMPLRMVGSLAK